MNDSLQFQKETQFFVDLMANLSISAAVCSENEIINRFGSSEELSAFIDHYIFPDFKKILSNVLDRTVYYFTDLMYSTHAILRLSEDTSAFLVIGPYTTIPNSKEYLMAILEKQPAPAEAHHLIEQYYSLIPHFPDVSFLQAAINAFASQLWGGADQFRVEQLAADSYRQPTLITALFSPEGQNITHMLNVSMLEKRYELENYMLAIITQGQIHKLDQFLAATHYEIPLEMRLADPLRNMKNYLIIFNTLLRKAAEQGGVHPLYINDTSAEFFVKIEGLRSVADSPALQKTMMRKYCLLVHNHSMKSYSQLVQKAIIHIDSDLTADLNLSTMANILNVNASYLSSHFHKETGQTLTAFVNSRRIDYAIMLLNTTSLQIQIIAQYCGISDINYFTRIFKKSVGVTPSQYRDSIR